VGKRKSADDATWETRKFKRGADKEKGNGGTVKIGRGKERALHCATVTHQSELLTRESKRRAFMVRE